MTDFLMILILLAIAAVDVKTKTISDGVTLIGILVALNVQAYYGDLKACVAGLTCGVLAMFSLNLLKVQKVGGGDAKLMAFIGAVFGWQVCLLTALMALVCDNMYRTIFEKRGLLPYAPAIVVAFILVRICQMLI